MSASAAPLLLDSHTFMWAMTAPETLPQRVRTALEDGARPVLLSAVSAWEIEMKVVRGRWPEAAPVMAQLASTLRQAAIGIVPVTLAHALAAARLKWAHRDPFDRMIAAQARAEGAILVTVDPVFAGLDLTVLWE
jgi:PIN domain nuclease of toxin-antitoxin system